MFPLGMAQLYIDSLKKTWKYRPGKVKAKPFAVGGLNLAIDCTSLTLASTWPKKKKVQVVFAN